MGLFGKSDYEKREENFAKTLGAILENELEASDLRNLCRELIGSFPKNGTQLKDKKGKVVIEFEDPVTRNDYLEFYFHYQDLGEVNDMLLAKYFINNGYLDEDDEDYDYLINHSSDDEDEDKQSKKSQKDSEMIEKITQKLNKEFEPESVYDEKELQNALRMFLQQAFPNSKVEREVSFNNNRDTLDILVDNRYAIEVKIPNNRTELRNLSAQLEEYQETYPEILALILDNKEKNLTNEILHYVKRYEQKLGIKSIIISGKKRL